MHLNNHVPYILCNVRSSHILCSLYNMKKSYTFTVTNVQQRVRLVLEACRSLELTQVRKSEHDVINQPTHGIVSFMATVRAPAACLTLPCDVTHLARPGARIFKTRLC